MTSAIRRFSAACIEPASLYEQKRAVLEAWKKSLLPQALAGEL